MILTFDDVITEAEHQAILAHIASAEFVDGKQTAGAAAQSVKRNEQVQFGSETIPAITQVVLEALRRHEPFRAAVQPKQLHSLMTSRYKPGMEYGLHVDDPLMGGDVLWRTDVSMTLFLSAPDEYDGGELAFESGSGELRFKLKPRSIICYPSTSLHRVMPVTSGERLAVVAWIHSRVREAAAREILYDLSVAREGVFQKQGKCREFDLLAKTYNNLVRRWAEP